MVSNVFPAASAYHENNSYRDNLFFLHPVRQPSTLGTQKTEDTKAASQRTSAS